MTVHAESLVERLIPTDTVAGLLTMAPALVEAALAIDSVAWRPLVEREVPTEFPPFITAGTTFKVDRTFGEWPSAYWRYTLAFAGQETLIVEAEPDADGETFHVVMTPEQTQKLNPAATAKGPLAYQFTEIMTARDDSGEVFHVGRGDGRIMVEPNPAAAAAGALLSLEEQMLAVVEQVLLGRITVDIQNYAIAGRSVTKIPVAELFTIRRDLKAAVWKQRNPGQFSQAVDVAFPSSTLIGPTPLRFRDRLIS